MPVPSRGAVPKEDTVVSHCPAKVQVAPTGTCTGISADALRIDPDGISVTWVEYFMPPPPVIEQAAKALKKARRPSATGVLARAKVERILEIAAKLKLTCTVLHTPDDDNEAHASITGCPDTLQVRLALARAFCDFIPNKSIPGFYP